MRALRLAIVAFLPLAFACDPLTTASPAQVTGRFWEALRTGDVAAARQLASAASATHVATLAEGRPIEEVLLGEALEGESSAIVRTSLVTSTDADPIHTTFDTHLVREAGAWRVDAATTEHEWTTAAFANNMKQIGEALGEGVQEFSEALEEGTAEIQRAIREALEELEKELQ